MKTVSVLAQPQEEKGIILTEQTATGSARCASNRKLWENIQNLTAKM